MRVVDALYAQAIKSTRGGPVFNAHSYPTKINKAAVVPFIVAHTEPGDLVFDGFAGTGATGLAVAFSGDAESEVAEATEKLLGSSHWGERSAVLYEISELGAFISDTLLHPPNPDRFLEVAETILSSLDDSWGWMYEALDGEGDQGSLRYVVWTDFPICPNCGMASSFWDLAIDLSGPSMARTVTCPHCDQSFGVGSAERSVEGYWDDLLQKSRMRRKRRPVFVYGRTGHSYWRRPVSEEDLELLKRVEATEAPAGVPIVPVLGEPGDERWGELYRSGYHFGITHLHDFYTRRNLIAVAAAWLATQEYAPTLKQALQFWISSYNATHSTIMARVVCKKSANDLVPTGAQPATLYVSSLPVEKNVFAGLRNKLGTIKKAFEKTYGRGENVSVHCGSSLNVDLPDASVDYIFTDPPFGNNIQYSEVNFISEAWLGRITERQEEAIISPHQEKSVEDYQSLLAEAFAEAFRILKPGHYMTVVFHSTQAETWGALRRAWKAAGFEMMQSSVLDKTQGSFKQTTTSGAVKGDPVILLRKPAADRRKSEDLKPRAPAQDIWALVAERIRSLDEQGDHSDSRNRQRLYSYVVTTYLDRDETVPLDAGEFFDELNRRFERCGGKYYLK